MGGTAASAQLPIPPPPTRRVNDYAGALSVAERERLEQKLVARERGTSNQIVVAIFRSLAGESLEDYSIRLAQAWRIGQKGLDNGVIFLVFLDDRKMRIEVGYGLEATLTDATAASIIRDVVAPQFRAGRLADGIDAGLDALSSAIAGTYAQPAPARQQARDARGELIWLGLVIMLVAGVPLLFLSLAQSRGVRRHGWTGGRSGWYGGGGWFPSGGGGFGSGGGGGGGGFSGGGGSFGGGGASGGW